MQDADTLCTFNRRLKTSLFNKALCYAAIGLSRWWTSHDALSSVLLYHSKYLMLT